MDEIRLGTNEHWLVLDGAIQIRIDELEPLLFAGDVAKLHAGASRRIHAIDGARAIVARE
jgi:hypothetical protein